MTTHFSNRMQDQVAKFHTAMGQPVNSSPRLLPDDRIGLRLQLIKEEVQELQNALNNRDLIETADACIDILYVTFGLLVETGIDAGPLFDEVQASNMSKLDEHGKPIISRGIELDGVYEGRVMKSAQYFRPRLAPLLDAQTTHTGR